MPFAHTLKNALKRGVGAVTGHKAEVALRCSGVPTPGGLLRVVVEIEPHVSFLGTELAIELREEIARPIAHMSTTTRIVGKLNFVEGIARHFTAIVPFPIHIPNGTVWSARARIETFGNHPTSPWVRVDQGDC